jgi:hypothetical protein
MSIAHAFLTPQNVNPSQRKDAKFTRLRRVAKNAKKRIVGANMLLCVVLIKLFLLNYKD